MWLAQLEALDVVVQGFDQDGFANCDALEGNAGQNLGLCARIAAPVRCEQRVPQHDERLLVLLGEPLVGPDGLVEPSALRPPLFE